PDPAGRHQFLDALWRPQVRADLPGGRGVDDDRVPATRPHLPVDLADGDDLPHRRGRGGESVECTGDAPAEAADPRKTQLEREVLEKGVRPGDLHRVEAGPDLPGLECERRRGEVAGQ